MKQVTIALKNTKKTISLSPEDKVTSRGEVKGEVPFRSLKGTGAKNLVLTPGILEVMNNVKLAVFTTAMVMSQGVATMGHTSHNSVAPSLLIDLVGVEPFALKGKSVSGTPNVPKHYGAEDVAHDVVSGGHEGVEVVIRRGARKSASGCFHPRNRGTVAQVAESLFQTCLTWWHVKRTCSVVSSSVFPHLSL